VCTTCGQEWPDDFKLCPNDGSSLRASSDAADLIGAVIADRYHITAKLGEGGMGAVYLAEHVRMGQKMAVKVLAKQLVDDADAIARFTREARNAARIKHPNVCIVHDFGIETDERLVYLAMEFIEGESLAELLKREGTLGLDQAAAIMAQCCDALQAAHDLGIVHRDLKPDNIMISRDRGGAAFVKVVDFGIAKAATGEAGQQVTKTGFILGTPDYMSPEQVAGETLDARSDVYSLALVLFRMLAEGLPFTGDTPHSVLMSRLTADPRTLEDVRPGSGLPSAIQEVLDRALARDRSKRFDSAVAFAGALASAVEQVEQTETTVVAAPDVETVRLETPQDAVAAPRVETPTPETPQPVPEPRRAGRRRAGIAAIGAVGVIGAVGLWMMGGFGADTAGLTPGDGGRAATATEDTTAADTSRTDVGSTFEARLPVPEGPVEPARDSAASAERDGTPVRDSAEAAAADDRPPAPETPAVWETIRSLTDAELQGVWGSDAANVWAVGGKGALLYFDGAEWDYALPPEASRHENSRLGSTGLDAVWGTGRTNVWAVGSIGTILHFDGSEWRDVSPEITRDRLRSVWGSGPADIWAVGDRGTILHFDGDAWTEDAASGTTDDDLYGVWVGDRANAWAVGESATIFRYDGTAWTEVSTDLTTEWLYAVWGSALNDVWAVGGGGTILRFDGTAWADATPLKRTRTGDVVPAHSHLLSGIGGTGPTDIWIAADYTVLHYDGSSWTDETPDQRHRLRHLWALRNGDVWAVGWWGEMLRLAR
jgi:serine/threonine-protein kinase